MCNPRKGKRVKQRVWTNIAENPNWQLEWGTWCLNHWILWYPFLGKPMHEHWQNWDLPCKDRINPRSTYRTVNHLKLLDHPFIPVTIYPFNCICALRTEAGSSPCPVCWSLHRFPAVMQKNIGVRETSDDVTIKNGWQISREIEFSNQKSWAYGFNKWIWIRQVSPPEKVWLDHWTWWTHWINWGLNWGLHQPNSGFNGLVLLDKIG